MIINCLSLWSTSLILVASIVTVATTASTSMREVQSAESRDSEHAGVADTSMSSQALRTNSGIRLFQAITTATLESPETRRHGSRLNHVVTVLNLGVLWCESGHTTTVHVICGYECSKIEELKTISCSRKENFAIHFHEFDLQEYGFALTGLHKLIVADELDKHDLFISTDDDILFTQWQLHEFLRLSTSLEELGLSHQYIPGFYVFEVDRRTQSLDFTQWKHVDHLNVVELDGQWFEVETGNAAYQAAWIATRAQVQYLNDTCKFLRPKPLDVHLMPELNMGLDITKACGMEKIIPLDAYFEFGIRHLANYKLESVGPMLGTIATSAKLVQLLRMSGASKQDSNQAQDEVSAIRLLQVVTTASAENPSEQRHGSRLNHVLSVLSVGVQWCEAGHITAIHIICGYECSQAPELQALQCSRESHFSVAFHEYDLQEHGFRLTGLHKDIVKKELHKHDIFLSSDDDILFTAWQLREFIDLSSRLQSLQASEEYYPGFFVYEIDTNSDSMDFVQWKHTHGLKVVQIGAEWYEVETGNSAYQASWVATREQLIRLHERCNFLQAKNGPKSLRLLPEGNMGLDMFDVKKCKYVKVIPLKSYEEFGVRHLANYKFNVKRARVRTSASIFCRLLQQQEANAKPTL